MRAIDTNIIIRLVTQDDQEQLSTALTIIGFPFLVLPTVILESVWVLQSVYKVDRVALAAKLTEIVGHENANLVSGNAMMWAVERFAMGADFADMLHIALASEAKASQFSTFDKSITKYVSNAKMPIETLV